MKIVYDNARKDYTGEKFKTNLETYDYLHARSDKDLELFISYINYLVITIKRNLGGEIL